MKLLLIIFMFIMTCNNSLAGESDFIIKKNSVIDTKENLEWFKVSKTHYKDYAYIKRDYQSPGGFFDSKEQWRHATKLEFQSLINNWFDLNGDYDATYQRNKHYYLQRRDGEKVESFIKTFGDSYASKTQRSVRQFKLIGAGSTSGILALETKSHQPNRPLLTTAIISDHQWQTYGGNFSDSTDYVLLKPFVTRSKNSNVLKKRSILIGHWIVRDTVTSKKPLKSKPVKVKKPTISIDPNSIPITKMVNIPSGTFTMGCSKEDTSCWNIERPNQKISIKKFKMGATEVTFDQYDFYCDKTPECQKPSDEGWGRGSRPVINVSAVDANLYIAWLNTHTGQKFRLPTESEWEYAARAGTTTKYYWGNTPNSKYANGVQKTALTKLGIPWDKTWVEWPNDGYLYTAPTASFKPNTWGLYDMVGNVHEWLADKWHGTLKRTNKAGKAWTRGRLQVLRSGSWDNTPFFLRIGMRGNSPSTIKTKSAGFRLALNE